MCELGFSSRVEPSKYKALGSLLNSKQTETNQTNTIKLEKKNLCLPRVSSEGKSGVRKG